MSRKPWSDWRPGILNGGQIKTLCDEGVIVGDLKESDFGLSSFDLHLDREGWEIRGSFKLKSTEHFQSLRKKEALFSEHEPLDLARPVTLKARHTYIIKVKERISAQGKEIRLCGMATGRSTIGRLDVLVRLVVDRHEEYDKIGEDKDADLFVEVTPITIPIKVREGDSLNQLRLFRGKPELCLINPESLKLFSDLIFTERKDQGSIDNTGLSLSVEPDNTYGENVIAFTTRKTDFTGDEAVDLRAPAGSLDPAKYWQPVFPSKDLSESVLIEKDRFYILRSKERFCLPDDIGVYCVAITENLGEIRIHYAGFVHPWFGHGTRSDSRKGTPLIFEVRGHTVDSFLRHDGLMARVQYFRMSEKAKEDNQSYTHQELKLSNYFGKWENSK
jgi:dCTP deaminase